MDDRRARLDAPSVQDEVPHDPRVARRADLDLLPVRGDPGDDLLGPNELALGGVGRRLDELDASVDGRDDETVTALDHRGFGDDGDGHDALPAGKRSAA